jgi:uncharacterized Zn finger protein
MEVLNAGSINFKDVIIRCGDCGKAFTFTAGEQRYYASKRLSTPKRCQECRQVRKQTLVPDTEVRHDND